MESASPARWRDLGRAEGALWGTYRGSRDYAVRASADDGHHGCSCPSRKRPCRHALGLMLLGATRPTTIPEAPPPPAVAEWLERRREAAERKAARAAKAVDADARAARRAKRLGNIRAGIEGLDLWLEDLVTHGLAGLETAGWGSFERQAARLVDAQATGLAGRVRGLSELPGASPAWPEEMVERLGRLALLSEAIRRVDELPEPLIDEVMRQVGVKIPRDEVLGRGERLRDRWQVVGQVVEELEDDIRAQRSWLVGEQSGREALLLQYAWRVRPFPEAIPVGRVVDAELAYYPGALPRRALIAERGEDRPMARPFANRCGVDEALSRVADALAASPWLQRFGLCLADVRPAVEGEDAWLVDGAGRSLPVAGEVPWTLVALSGGHPVHVAGEWDGRALTPLGAWTGGRWHRLRGM